VIDENLTNKRKSEMTSAERVQIFQRKLYSKAKQEADFRFYVLYDKLSLPYFLKESWRRVKANKGVAGYDGLGFGDIEKIGVIEYLNEIKDELKSETYRPQPVLRVYIEKKNGKLRPLGIPTIKDRIVQMCCKMIIEPIFEADFEDCSYGFRPKRSAHDAIKAIKSNLEQGRKEVYDADLSGFFDTIPHNKLMKLVERRITDKRILKLIRMWLKAPYFDNNKLHKNRIGTPQGGVISPLLANIYLHLVDKAVSRRDGKFHKYGVRIVRYADDFILMANKIPQHCLDYLKAILDKMELRVNENKTSLINSLESSFDFLGFTFRYDKDIYGRKYKYLNIIPSKKSLISLRSKLREYFKYNGHKNPFIISNDISRKLKGWSNYFTIQEVSYPRKAKKSIRYYLMKKLYRFYKRKSQRKCKLSRQNAYEILIRKYDMYNILNRYENSTVNA
jgi:group II intron reverse transcriptase/maturase